jgi:hypothetical protein
MTRLLETLLGLNTKLRTAFLVFLAAVLVNRFPVLITSWCPADLQHMIFKAAHDLIYASLAAGLLFAKQHNVTGNGTLMAPFEKSNSGHVDLRLLLGMTVIALLFAFGLTGCAPNKEWSTAGVLEIASRYGTAGVYLTTNGSTYTVKVNADEIFKRQTAGLAK